MVEDVWDWCEKTGARGRTVTIKVKWADFEQSTRSRSLPGPVTTKADLAQTSLALVRTLFPTPKGVRLVGVTLSNFQGPVAEPAPEQLDFTAPLGTG